MEKTISISNVIGDFLLLLFTLISIPTLVIVIIYLMKRYLIGERRRLLALREDVRKWFDKAKSNLILLHLNNVNNSVEDLSESAIMSMGVGEIFRYIKYASKAYYELSLILSMQKIITLLTHELDNEVDRLGDERKILDNFINKKLSQYEIPNLIDDYEHLRTLCLAVNLRYDT